MIDCTAADSGTSCARPFFDRSAGIVQISPLISLHRIPATSRRRCPVRTRSCKN
jgi:hypothetical protein